MTQTCGNKAQVPEPCAHRARGKVGAKKVRAVASSAVSHLHDKRPRTPRQLAAWRARSRERPDGCHIRRGYWRQPTWSERGLPLRAGEGAC